MESHPNAALLSSRRHLYALSAPRFCSQKWFSASQIQDVLRGWRFSKNSSSVWHILLSAKEQKCWVHYWKETVVIKEVPTARPECDKVTFKKKSLHPRVCWHTPVNITLRSGCRQISVFQVCLWDRVLQHTLAGLELSKQSKLVWNLGRCFAASWVLGLQICAVLPGSHLYSPVMFPLDGRGVTSFPI